MILLQNWSWHFTILTPMRKPSDKFIVSVQSVGKFRYSFGFLPLGEMKWHRIEHAWNTLKSHKWNREFLKYSSCFIIMLTRARCVTLSFFIVSIVHCIYMRFCWCVCACQALLGCFFPSSYYFYVLLLYRVLSIFSKSHSLGMFETSISAMFLLSSTVLPKWALE